MRKALKFSSIALLVFTFLFPVTALADKGHKKEGHDKENYEEGSGSSAMEHGKATSDAAKAKHEGKEEGRANKAGQGDAAHEDSGKHMGMEKGKGASKADHKKEGS